MSIDASMAEPDGIRNPMEIYSRFHGNDWTPQRAAFHQNLDQFADRIGLIVGLQANGNQPRGSLRTDQKLMEDTKNQPKGFAPRK